MFTAALFTIARTWKQPKCPLTEEWIKKISYIYTIEYYSTIKKVKPKLNRLLLYSRSDKQIQGIRPDTVHEELWTKVSDIVQEGVIKTIPKKKKYKKAKWLSEEALQIAEKTREAKGKGEKERYTHLNAEFQRIASRHKKAFFKEHCKETEENNNGKD